MKRLFGTLVTTLLLAGLARPAVAAEAPAPAVLLFWASWCAPCQAELRQLPALREAAAPFALRVVPYESNGRDLPRTVRAEERWVPARPVIALLADWKLPAALPLTVVVGRSGDRCAVVRGGISAPQLAALVRRCR